MADNTGKSRKKKTPRYLQLAGDLREEIMSGRFVSGDQFPTESDLCRRYGVSRFTVREALRRLQAEGLIARKRGSGTTVQPAAARGGTLHQPLSNVGEMLQYARETQTDFEPAGKGPLPKDIAVHVAAATDSDWSVLRGVRRKGADGTGAPIAAVDAYLHERLGDIAGSLDLVAGTLFAQIEQKTGVIVGKVTQDIQAIAASERVAGALGMRQGEPVLRILRSFFDTDGDLFEISVSHHPGDSFAYSMHIDLDK